QVVVDGPVVAAPALEKGIGSVPGSTFTAGDFWAGYQITNGIWRWDVETAGKLAALQTAAAREVGALAVLPTTLNIQAHIDGLNGDLDAAASKVTEIEEILTETGSLLTRTAPALVAAMRGDADAVKVIDAQIARGRTDQLETYIAIAEYARLIYLNGAGRYEQA